MKTGIPSFLTVGRMIRCLPYGRQIDFGDLLLLLVSTSIPAFSQSLSLGIDSLRHLPAQRGGHTETDWLKDNHTPYSFPQRCLLPEDRYPSLFAQINTDKP